ncbi:hypothetical protein [Haloquadratum walsbyi]|uniref:hypothetical protein n=1 Tax=Haloquadratum walsbyi TaxID=293091 RepID=UPI0030845B30
MWRLAYGHGHPGRRARESTRRVDGGPTERTRRDRRAIPPRARLRDGGRRGGGGEVIVIVGYGAGQIVDRFSDTFEGVPITYVH